MSLLLFIFAVACQAGEDNRVVYDDSSSGGYTESLYDTEDHDGDKEDHDIDEDHDEDKEDHDADEDHDSDKEDHDADEDHDSDEDHEANDHDEEIIDALSKIEAIIEPENLSWPRKVLINDEEITITERPEKVLTISLGHDEILFGVSNTDQIAGTTSFAQEGGSNIEKKSEGLPIVTTDPETIISLSPDLVFADPYASIELMDTLKDVGITVIQTSLNNSSEGRKKDVWLMSYITGNLENALLLSEDIDNKVEILNDLAKSNTEKTKNVITLSWWDAYWTAGNGSTEDAIIQLAGGKNVAAANGVESNNTIEKELLISMNPEMILITQSVQWGGQDFYDDLMSDESLASIEAIKNDEVYMVNSNWWTTLSYWNIKGSEELAKILWDLDDIENFGDFE
ncbi:MAG: hypothetical protein CL761_04830 [Chloroflexi bacterium]|nr:hypothetical protein [Chloroflexota bacterium]